MILTVEYFFLVLEIYDLDWVTCHVLIVFPGGVKYL